MYNDFVSMYTYNWVFEEFGVGFLKLFLFCLNLSKLVSNLELVSKCWTLTLIKLVVAHLLKVTGITI